MSRLTIPKHDTPQRGRPPRISQLKLISDPATLSRTGVAPALSRSGRANATCRHRLGQSLQCAVERGPTHSEISGSGRPRADTQGLCKTNRGDHFPTCESLRARGDCASGPCFSPQSSHLTNPPSASESIPDRALTSSGAGLAARDVGPISKELVEMSDRRSMLPPAPMQAGY